MPREFSGQLHSTATASRQPAPVEQRLIDILSDPNLTKSFRSAASSSPGEMAMDKTDHPDAVGISESPSTGAPVAPPSDDSWRMERLLPETFCDESDAILLLGVDAMEPAATSNESASGLNGSPQEPKMLEACQVESTVEDFEEALRALSLGGAVKSLTRVGLQGLAVTLARGCGWGGGSSLSRSFGAEVDLNGAEANGLAVIPLFAESAMQAVLTCHRIQVGKILSQARIYGVGGRVIGRVTLRRLRISAGSDLIDLDLAGFSGSDAGQAPPNSGGPGEVP